MVRSIHGIPIGSSLCLAGRNFRLTQVAFQRNPRLQRQVNRVEMKCSLSFALWSKSLDLTFGTASLWHLWFVVYDTVLLGAAVSMKPSAFGHCRLLHAMVIFIAMIPFLRMRNRPTV